MERKREIEHFGSSGNPSRLEQWFKTLGQESEKPLQLELRPVGAVFFPSCHGVSRVLNQKRE